MRSTLPDRICPACGKIYRDYPALSREDNRTEICPDCGIVQGLKASGAVDTSIYKVLHIIHAEPGNERS